MTRRYLFKSSLLCLWLVASEPLRGEPSVEISPGAQFSANLEASLASMKSSKYQHRTDIEASVGRFHCDCSGFLGHALAASFPEAFLALQGDLAPWKSRPLAATFYETFDRAGTGGDGLWQKVPRLMDALPGDLMAWRRPVLMKGKSTGHVCMVAGLPRQEADGRIRVRVVDSTNRAHSNDTRLKGQTGIGAGEMWFEVDQSGRPIAFIPRKNSKRIDSNRILIGRLHSGKEIATTTNSADDDLIGMSEKNAEELATKRGLGWRVITREGKVIPVSLLRMNSKRLNVVVSKGKVIRVRRG